MITEIDRHPLAVFLLLLTFGCIMSDFATAQEPPRNIDAEAGVLKFVSQWLELSQDNKNLNAVMEMYGDTVDFYKLGSVSKAAVMEDKKKYFDRWPMRKHKLVSLKVQPGATKTPLEVSVTFHYVIRSVKGATKEGDANSTILLTKKKDSYVIISEKDTTTQIAGAENLKCMYEQRFKGGGSKGAEARLTIEKGKIIGLTIYSSVSSGKEGGGYVCGIDTSEQDQKITWSIKDKKTILDVEDDLPGNKSVIEIEQIGNSYKINLEKASLSACGFGADWPRAVVIERGNEKCRVEN